MKVKLFFLFFTLSLFTNQLFAVLAKSTFVRSKETHELGLLKVLPIDLPIEYGSNGRTTHFRQPKLVIDLSMPNGETYSFTEKGADFDIFLPVIARGNTSAFRAKVKITDVSRSHYLLRGKKHSKNIDLKIVSARLAEIPQGTLKIQCEEYPSGKKSGRHIYFTATLSVPDDWFLQYY